MPFSRILLEAFNLSIFISYLQWISLENPSNWLLPNHSQGSLFWICAVILIHSGRLCVQMYYALNNSRSLFDFLDQRMCQLVLLVLNWLICCRCVLLDWDFCKYNQACMISSLLISHSKLCHIIITRGLVRFSFSYCHID